MAIAGLHGVVDNVLGDICRTGDVRMEVRGWMEGLRLVDLKNNISW